ncbi:MAG: hypothetical protein IPL55_09465 [Saprospiraceae bacterium]|nr:hypothetical protein [Saprospiraceae bacterium]
MVLGSKPGERLEVDYAGDKLKYIDKESGEIKQCDVLVCVLPYSDLIYCEAQEDQSQMNFVEGIGRSLHYIGNVPKLIISDNLKSGIKTPDKYEPKLTDLSEQMSLYYETHDGHTGKEAQRQSQCRTQCDIGLSAHIRCN